MALAVLAVLPAAVFPAAARGAMAVASLVEGVGGAANRVLASGANVTDSAARFAGALTDGKEPVRKQAHATLDLLRETNSYGQLALCYLRKGERQQALEKALQTKDRFKGKRTKYYVLKGFTSTAEVILKLLEDAILRRRRTDALSSTQSLSVAPDGSPAGRSRRNSLTRANSRVSRAVASRLTKVGRQSTAIGDAASGGRGVQVEGLVQHGRCAPRLLRPLEPAHKYEPP